MSRDRFSRRYMLLTTACMLCAAVLACENNEEPGLPSVPTINSVIPAIASSGDTVVINGANFNPSPAANTVLFNNPVSSATPFAGGATRLRVVVSRDAVSGPVSVSVPDQPQAGRGGSLAVPARGVGEVWVYGKTGSPFEATYPAADAEYLLIPHASNPTSSYVSVFNYGITADAGLPVAALPSSQRVMADPRAGSEIRELFDLHLRGEERRLGEAMRSGTLKTPRSRPERLQVAPEPTRNFFVLKAQRVDVTKSSSYEKITAHLVAEGAHCLVYADVDTQVTGNFSKTDYDYFAATFDAPIYVTNTQSFGSEHDVDGNGKVIVVITPVVNRLTDPGATSFVAGFFNSVDLYPPGGGIDAGATNVAEIVYVLAADPDGVYSRGHTVEFLRLENVSTLAHEFQHLISFSVRIFEQGGRTQVTWLEEGMAHLAEDLNGFNASNIRRAARYLADPSLISLEDNGVPTSQRGGIYLMLRWLGDRFGEDIFKPLVASRCSGRSCIEAITGEDFYVTVADFFATLYLSGRAITQDPAYQLDVLDLVYNDPFDPVVLPVANKSTDGGPVSGSVKRTSGEFILFTNSTTPQTMFTIDADPTARMRIVVVRTR